MKKLAIIDWGIGGCGLHKKLRSMVNYPITYFSDSGFVPYGKVNPETLSRRLENVMGYLSKIGTTHFAIACNAASTVIKDSDNTTTILTHGLKMLTNQVQKTGVIGGIRTIESGLFNKPWIKQQIAQPLSAYVESGLPQDEDIRTLLHEILDPMLPLDVLFLGCTHYPALTHEIQQVTGNECLIMDPAHNMANWIVSNWNLTPKNSVRDIWLTTGDKNQTIESAEKAFDVKIEGIERVEIDI